MRVVGLTAVNPAFFEDAWRGRPVPLPANMKIAPTDIVVLGESGPSRREVQGKVRPGLDASGARALLLVPALRWNL